MDEKKYMDLALALAKKGEGHVNPNPLVGAVVVKNKQIIGQGYHKFYGGSHAEVYALDEAGEEAKGADIYVTLEPCSHYGKTPPCAEKIIKFGIKRCIIAMEDPNPLVAGNGIKMMKEAGIEVVCGLLEKEALELNRIFIKYILEKEAYLFLKCAITLDGKIASKTGDSKWISNEKAREEVQRLRNKLMGIMIGINTVIKDDPRLTARIKNGLDPFRIVIDPNLLIPFEAKLLNYEDKKTIIVSSIENKETEKYKKLLEKGHKFIFLEGKEFEIKLILKELAKLKIDSVLVEGGAGLISSCFKQKIIDEGQIFIAPKITGDEKALSFVKGFDINLMKDSMELKNPRYKVYEDNISIKFDGIK